jgi:predicted SpoU family rRNA methylase
MKKNKKTYIKLIREVVEKYKCKIEYTSQTSFKKPWKEWETFTMFLQFKHIHIDDLIELEKIFCVKIRMVFPSSEVGHVCIIINSENNLKKPTT